jgi:heat shock protein HslJ
VAIVVAVAAFAFVTSAFDQGGPDVAEPAPVSPDALRGTAWVVLRIDGEVALEENWFEQDAWLTVSFDETTFRAVSGCNDSLGSYELVDGILASSGGSTTTAGCAGSDQQRGSAVFDILRSSPTVQPGPAALTLTTPTRSLDLRQHPCTLLSEDEVASATGVDASVIHSDLVPPSGFKVRPEFGPSCRYDEAGAFSSVIASVRPISLEGFGELRGADPSNTIVVDGIGEGAFIDGMSGISVLDGGRLIQLGLQHGAGRDAIPVLEALARAALDGVGVPLDGPSAAEPLVIEIRPGELLDGVQYGPTLRASFGGRTVPLQAIETPGDELAYPTRELGVAVPLGTLIEVVHDGHRVRVRKLVPVGEGELVERAAIHDGELVAFDEPGRVAISVLYADDVGTGELGLIVNVLEDEHAARPGTSGP